MAQGESWQFPHGFVIPDNDMKAAFTLRCLNPAALGQTLAPFKAHGARAGNGIHFCDTTKKVFPKTIVFI